VRTTPCDAYFGEGRSFQSVHDPRTADAVLNGHLSDAIAVETTRVIGCLSLMYQTRRRSATLAPNGHHFISSASRWPGGLVVALA
jgi:hypothetical protein